MKNFNTCLKPLLEHEGGNDDDPQDPGGRTSRGIIQREYDRYRDRKGKPRRDVWSAADDEVHEIYRKEYWDVLRCDELPAGVDYAVFDYGVNSGVARAAKVLQRAVGANIDGEIGPQTIEFAAASRIMVPHIVDAICDERLAFLQGLRTWPRFGHGWARRVADVRATALKMAAAAPAPTQPLPKAAAGKSWLATVVDALLALFRRAPATPAPVPVPAHPADTTPPWMRAAQKEIGFHEVGQNRGIEHYIELAHTGSLVDPWCAVFVNAMLESAGIRGTRSAMARSFESSDQFVRLDGPAYGAITTMWRGSPGSGLGHVFFYAGENDRGILALGGNQSDQVCRQYEPHNRIVGYFWPRSVPRPLVGKIIVKDEGQREGSET